MIMEVDYMRTDLQFFGGRGAGASTGGGAESPLPSIPSFGALANSETQSFHRQQMSTLNSDTYEDGTYDISTLEPVGYDSGYQVTFSQIGDRYSNGEYAEKVNEFLSASTDGKTSAGKFESEPEVSFHVKSKTQAVRMAKKYNQISVWDWKNSCEIKTGGTGRRN